MLEATLMKRILWLLVLALSPYDAGAQNPFYQGKTITVIAGVSAGSVYDLYARLITQHMGKHIPGNPNFVVQNMTGAGSIIGANYLYNVAKPDGLTIGAVQSSIFFNQLQKHQEVKFDWAKFTWIGSSDKSDWLLYMRADLPYKSLAHVGRTGAWPTRGLGPVTDAPTETWMAVDSALVSGRRGLSGGSTLARFLRQHGRTGPTR